MRRGAAVLVVLGSLAAAAPAAAARPPELRLTHARHTVVATQGSYCYAEGGTGICADFAYPLRTRGVLAVGPGSVVTLRIGRAAAGVSVKPIRLRGEDFTFGRSRAARPINRPRTIWTVAMPAGIAGFNRLSVQVDYGRAGDGNFWAAIRRR